MTNRTGLGIVCAFGAAAMYGLMPNFVRAAFEGGVPPVESTLARTFLISVMFSVLAVIQGQSFVIPRPAIPSFLWQAVSTLLVSVCYLGSVQFISVGLAVIIFYFFPVLIMLSAPLIEGRNPGLFRMLIAVMAFIGLGVAVGPSFQTLDIRGLLLATLGTLGATIQFFSGRTISRYMATSVFGSLVHVAILPPFFVIVLYFGGGKLALLPGGSATSTGLAFVAGLAVLYVVAYMVQMLSLRFATASTVAPYYNIEPVIATLAAVAILGETLAINQYIGGAIVLAALVLSSLAGRLKR